MIQSSTFVRLLVFAVIVFSAIADLRAQETPDDPERDPFARSQSNPRGQSESLIRQRTQSQATQAQSGVRGFDGASFSCASFTEGLAPNAPGRAQSQLALVWIHGYLGGYLKAQNRLDLSEDKGVQEEFLTTMVKRCAENPEATLLAASQAVGAENFKLPAQVLGGFTLASYACGEYVKAMRGDRGADTNRANTASLWATTFVLGFKHVAQKDAVVGAKNVPTLIDNLTRGCERNAGATLLDITADVAAKIKLK